MTNVLIDIKNLTVDYTSRSGLFGRQKQVVRVLDNLNLQIRQGETLSVVGESGCGKSSLANAILHLINPAGGQILYQNRDILRLNPADLRQMRQHMQLVFQNPHASLNPRMEVFDLVAEPLRTHTQMEPKALADRVKELLLEVGLSTEYLKRHPHELSGGQAQRVAIARALALKPAFLILDEPTAALDISVQAKIINLLVRLQREHNLTYLFISHDLGIVRHVSDRIAVMYLGEIVEEGPTEAIFEMPHHPYTQALLSAVPSLDPGRIKKHLILEGSVPSLAEPPAGCRFHPRCPVAMDICRTTVPPAQIGPDKRRAACHFLTDALFESFVEAMREYR